MKHEVGLIGFKFKCEATFCRVYWYLESYDNMFGFKVAGQEDIAKDNPVVKVDRLDYWSYSIAGNNDQ
ncbi:hypothetical protein CDL15_Pgr017784 [Punica granatum]|nr:hypothetical protein CDL15_Pgr017784 [Punica granatum]